MGACATGSHTAPGSQPPAARRRQAARRPDETPQLLLWRPAVQRLASAYGGTRALGCIARRSMPLEVQRHRRPKPSAGARSTLQPWGNASGSTDKARRYRNAAPGAPFAQPSDPRQQEATSTPTRPVRQRQMVSDDLRSAPFAATLRPARAIHLSAGVGNYKQPSNDPVCERDWVADAGISREQFLSGAEPVRSSPASGRRHAGGVVAVHRPAFAGAGAFINTGRSDGRCGAGRTPASCVLGRRRRGWRPRRPRRETGFRPSGPARSGQATR